MLNYYILYTLNKFWAMFWSRNNQFSHFKWVWIPTSDARPKYFFLLITERFRWVFHDYHTRIWCSFALHFILLIEQNYQFKINLSFSSQYNSTPDSRPFSGPFSRLPTISRPALPAPDPFLPYFPVSRIPPCRVSPIERRCVDVLRSVLQMCMKTTHV